jgi:hypothetical protein
LHSPVRDREPSVLPGVQTQVPPSRLLLREEALPTVSLTRPLSQQGWERRPSPRSVPDQGEPELPNLPPSQGSLEETDQSEEDPDPPSSSSKHGAVPIYENINPSDPGAPRVPIPRTRSAQQHPRGATARPEPESRSSTVSPPLVSTPRSILKPHTPGAPKKVKYSPSTKREAPVKPVKRPPTPDFEVAIRPTSALDILDEVLAGQPSRRVGGRTIPDTLITVSEPTPHDKAKKVKKTIPPTDRTLRSKKS